MPFTQYNVPGTLIVPDMGISPASLPPPAPGYTPRPPEPAQAPSGSLFPASRTPRAVSTFSSSSPPSTKNTMSAKIAGR